MPDKTEIKINKINFKINKTKPLIMKPESTVKDVAEKTLKGFSEKIKEVKLWGPSSKFPGQIVGLKHRVKDIELIYSAKEDLYKQAVTKKGYEIEKYSVRIVQRHLKAIFDELFNIGLNQKDTKNRTVIHTLRHTFASHLAINSTPIFTISKLMNHSDIKMTMRYAKVSSQTGRDSVKGLYE